jgi:hypothetical protein
VTIIVASAPRWTDIVTATGTVLAGLALPLAFIQLGALRQDRLRAQVSKVRAWTGAPDQSGKESALWTIPVLIRDGSELPAQVDAVDLVVRPWGDERVLAAPEGTGEVDYYVHKRFGDRAQAYFAPERSRPRIRGASHTTMSRRLPSNCPGRPWPPSTASSSQTPRVTNG